MEVPSVPIGWGEDDFIESLVKDGEDWRGAGERVKIGASVGEPFLLGGFFNLDISEQEVYHLAGKERRLYSINGSCTSSPAASILGGDW